VTQPAVQSPDKVMVPAGVRPITDRELRSFQELVYRETGIFLGPHKKSLIMGRLAGRLRQLGLSSFGD
jgi:chemotaxis protein methyltransferase CheR